MAGCLAVNLLNPFITMAKSLLKNTIKNNSLQSDTNYICDLSVLSLDCRQTQTALIAILKLQI